MCARYNSITRPSLIGKVGISWVHPGVAEVPTEMYPRYRGAVMRLREGDLGLDVMTWGLIPGWAKEPDPKKFRHTFNARSETANSLASFRTPFRQRRCLVPAESFTEFVTTSGQKVRHRIASADGAPLLFAGLWDRWTAADRSDELLSYTILTTEPHPGLRWIHHRFPVVLTASAAEEWLDPTTTPERAKALLVPPPPEVIQAVPA